MTNTKNNAQNNSAQNNATESNSNSPSGANRLRIAVQKSGKLSKDSLDLIKKCGLTVFESKNQLLCRISEMPIDILMVRDDDIPVFISQGICDLGILGDNVFQETMLSSAKDLNLKTVLPLGFSKCRLSLAVPNAMEFSSVENLQNMKIATSYPAILQQFLDANTTQCDIIKMEGSVEVAPHLNIADVICDIVSTGTTLQANGLKEAQTIFRSQAVLVGQKSALSNEKQAIADRLLQRIQGVIQAKESKYVMLNAPKNKVDAITAILGGADSPSIMPLADENTVAIHAVCKEPIFWETMEKLKGTGATSILVLPIEKMLD